MLLTSSLECEPISTADLQVPDGTALLRSIAQIRTYRREQEIYCQEQKSEGWYCVVSGVVRKYHLKQDGRRQIVDFHLPGDFFGVTCRAYHQFGVQAITDETVTAFYARQKLENLMGSDAAAARQVRQKCVEAIERLEQQMLVMGTMSAPEKVRAFLIYFHGRVAKFGDDGSLTLPISRYDIADMLGISAETVCRAFTELRIRGDISLEGPRHVRMVRGAAETY